jgi:hypothetical protein
MQKFYLFWEVDDTSFRFEGLATILSTRYLLAFPASGSLQAISSPSLAGRVASGFFSIFSIILLIASSTTSLAMT